MKKLMILIAAVMLAGLYLSAEADKPAADAKDAKKEAKVQTTCPITGHAAVDKKTFVDVKGKRIYMCCPGCAKTIKADPDKYIKQLEDQGIVLEKAPEAKPEAKDEKAK
ncbi:MAG: hypothetical protein WAX69_22515 [Victivallales bacterium]